MRWERRAVNVFLTQATVDEQLRKRSYYSDIRMGMTDENMQAVKFRHL
jgi:hypothetical protein